MANAGRFRYGEPMQGRPAGGHGQSPEPWAARIRLTHRSMGTASSERMHRVGRSSFGSEENTMMDTMWWDLDAYFKTRTRPLRLNCPSDADRLELFAWLD